MSRSSGMNDKKSKDLHDLDIDELVDRLTPGEIQTFLEDCDPGTQMTCYFVVWKIFQHGSGCYKSFFFSR